MSNILIITDQPLYAHSEKRTIAGSTVTVKSIFAGDIIDKKLNAMLIKSMKYDKILHPITITKHTPGGEDILDYIYQIRDNSEGCSISTYGNKY